MSDKQFVTYKEFGAVGDGVTNDFFKIKAAHDYANLHGIPVVAGDGCYYISDTVVDGAPVTIAIRTDVDFGEARFIIDDTDLSYSDRRSKFPIFTVESEYEKLTLTDEETLSRLYGIGEGTKKLDLELGYPALVIPYNENHAVYNRYGASYAARGGQKSPTREILLIDKDGSIDDSTPFMFNYDTVTKLEIIRIDVKPLTLKGGVFVTRSSRFNIFPVNEATGERDVLYGYFERGIIVKRSYTVLDGLSHYIEGEINVREEKELGIGGPCYHGFFSATTANEVTFKNCVMTGRRCYRRPKGGTGGTYDFSASFINKILLVNCTQSNFYVDTMTGVAPTADAKPENIVLSMAASAVTGTQMCWGIGGTNFCKNMEYHGCKLSRFDAHQGLLNGKIIDSTITFMALTGKGNLILENTHWISPGPGAVNNCMLYLRNDYGATWDGTISLKNCKATVFDGECYLVQHSFINWDYGYSCHFPNILVDNLTLVGRDAGYEISFTSEWKSMGQEPNMHLSETLNVPYKDPDTGEESSKNVNPIVPPEFITIVNNEGGYKYLMTNDLPFFKNTKIDGVTLVEKNERKI